VLRSSDRRAVALLVGIPLVAFVVPALFGHPAIAGDNLIQNFPLRALSGDLIRHGHLPLWNQFVWSGSPLLGGLNAGSLYPGTLAFVVLPAVAAWVVNLLAAYWAGALGLYLLLRQFRLTPLPALLAAATYAFAGAMTGQMVHLPIVQGMGWIPLMILGQVRLAWALFGTGPAGEPTRGRSSPWPWVALLAAAMGLVLLTGEPRGIAEAEVVAPMVALWLVLRSYGGTVGVRQRLAYVGWSVLGAIWAIALGLVQLLPGWSFINASQRASETYTFFGAGSLHPQWSVLLLVPNLFGGSGLLRQPTFFNSYNLPEVTGYVGLLPLVALFALGTRTFGRHRDPRSRDWGLWMLLAGFGLLASWGSYTPLGHLFWHIPLFGKTRLQSRNLGIVDLGLAAMLGYWLDGVVRDWRRWVAAVPALAAATCCVVAIAVPGPLESAFDFSGGGNAVLGRDLSWWFVAQLLVAGSAAALVLGQPRLSSGAWRHGVAILVAVDLALFSLSSASGFVPGHPSFQPSRAQAAAVLGTRGRFAIYDTTGQNLQVLSAIGQPDLNAFTGLPSVQGYGSIVESGYGNETGAHFLDTFDPCALARGVFDPLRLATLLTLPQFLAPQVVAGRSAQLPVPPAGQSASACPGAPSPGTAATRSLYLGQVLDVSTVSVVLEHPGGHRGRAAPRIGVVGIDGRTSWPNASVVATGDGWTARFARARPGVGIVVVGAGGTVSARSSVVAMGGTYSFDGVLQDAVGQAGWRYVGLWQGFVRFDRLHVRPPVWLAGSPRARVRQLSVGADGSVLVAVSAPEPVVVVRSEAYQKGWHVDAVPVGGGPTRSLPVVADGLVQEVHVPAGSYLLTFRYRASGLTLGLLGSSLALGGFVVLGIVAWRRRVRSRPVPTGPGDAED